MFTGLVDAIGVLHAVRTSDAGRELTIRSPYTDLVPGESIAVNGACLTVREPGAGVFTVAAVATTLDRTAIGRWTDGRRVNLERALRAGDRIGGHFVQGHVDCVGVVSGVARRDDAVLMTVELKEGIWELLAPLGSVAVDGVSLTVNALPQRDVLEVSLIEYTLSHTALADLGLGDEVHVEADMLAKHVQRLLDVRSPGNGASGER